MPSDDSKNFWPLLHDKQIDNSTEIVVDFYSCIFMFQPAGAVAIATIVCGLC